MAKAKSKKPAEEPQNFDQQRQELLDKAKKAGHIEQRDIFAAIPETAENAEVLDALYTDLADLNWKSPLPNPTLRRFTDEWEAEEAEEEVANNTPVYLGRRRRRRLRPTLSARNRQNSATQCRGRVGPGPARGLRRQKSQGQNGRSQHAPGGLALPSATLAAVWTYWTSSKKVTPAYCAPLRNSTPTKALNFQHLRHLVDSPGYHPRHRRPSPHYPHPGAHGRDHQQIAAHSTTPDTGTKPRAKQRRNRQGNGNRRRQSRAHHENQAGHYLSLDASIRDDEEDSVLADFIEDEDTVSPEESATGQLLKEQVKDMLGALTEREQKILKLRFGLEDGKSHTLEEVGQEFSVTRERIRQIEAKALAKLRKHRDAKKLHDYIK